MEQKHSQIKELQAVALALFKDFLQVCGTLGLRYYVLGGTALGAVRHKGFIPWDDDIDVGMPRADYQVFLEKAQALLPESVFLQTFETDPEFYANFAKLRNSGTTFIETSLRNSNMNHGVYIDIFPLDDYPDGKWDRFWVKACNMLLNGRLAAAFYYDDSLPLRSRLKHTICKILCPSLDKALRDRDLLMRSCRSGSILANYCGAWGEKEFVPAEWFSDGCELEFEGLPVRVPKEYHRYLTQLYGDYMTPPPPEKRIGHHYADVIDLHKPYTAYRSKQP